MRCAFTINKYLDLSPHIKNVLAEISEMSRNVVSLVNRSGHARDVQPSTAFFVKFMENFSSN